MRKKNFNNFVKAGEAGKNSEFRIQNSELKESFIFHIFRFTILLFIIHYSLFINSANSQEIDTNEYKTQTIEVDALKGVERLTPITFENIKEKTKFTLHHSGILKGTMSEQIYQGWCQTLDKFSDSLKYSLPRNSTSNIKQQLNHS